VRVEERVVHRVETTAFACELRRAERAPRIDDHVALPHLQADARRHRLQVIVNALGTGTAEIDFAGDALCRGLGMQLKRQPGDVNRSLALELFDPDRVDVAPRSNVVREDDQIDRRRLGHSFINTRRAPSEFLLRPLTSRWHNGLEGSLGGHPADRWRSLRFS